MMITSRFHILRTWFDGDSHWLVFSPKPHINASGLCMRFRRLSGHFVPYR